VDTSDPRPARVPPGEWSPDLEPEWFDGRRGGGDPGEVVCHGDLGPWNIVWRGTTPVGLLDWEYASLAPPRQDVAYALEYMAPFRDDQECLRWLRYPEPPDRKRRIEIFTEAYGLTSTKGLVDEVFAVQQLDVETVRALAEQGYERQVAMIESGGLDDFRAKIRWSEEHRHLFE
jgi:aminoglycoside phosphotransferase (APT) family kinase protein